MTAFSIVLLAMIAAFLGMRLYSVLGKRTGHEQEPVLPRERAAAAPVRLDEGDGAQVPASAPTDTSGLVYEPAAEAGLRQLLATDRNFDAGRFMGRVSETAYDVLQGCPAIVSCYVRPHPADLPLRVDVPASAIGLDHRFLPEDAFEPSPRAGGAVGPAGRPPAWLPAAL